jgi:hypothetical protein
MALDKRLEQVSDRLLSNCSKLGNIYICDDDIEMYIEQSENKKDDVEKVKDYLLSNYSIKFTTWD